MPLEVRLIIVAKGQVSPEPLVYLVGRPKVPPVMTCGGVVGWEGGVEALFRDPERLLKAKSPGRTARMATTARGTLALCNDDETDFKWHLPSGARTVTSWGHVIAIEHTIMHVRNRDHVGGVRLLPQ